MRVLLDTHVAIWSLSHPERLDRRGRDIIADPTNTLFVSVVSIWEIAIKRALGRANAPPFKAAEAVDLFGEAGFLILDIQTKHAVAVERLPPLHGDPFDRLLVAQALNEPLRMLTSDLDVARYSDIFLVV